MKLNKNYDCVFKTLSSMILKSLQVSSWKMCYFHFQMQVCTNVVMCGSNENYFG